MVAVGKVAFCVILALGAVSGYLVYVLFAAVTPIPGEIDSPYRENVTSVGSTNTGGNPKPVIDESKFANKVSITILKGASVQGNTNFSPVEAQSSIDALVIWTNNDDVPHTATSGAGTSDPVSGKLFDSNMISPGGRFSVAAKTIGPGEHPYYCSFHPFMKGNIAVK